MPRTSSRTPTSKVLAKPRFLRNDDDLGYLMRVLRNTFYSQRRTAARRPQTQEVEEGFDAPDPRAGQRPEEAVVTREVFAVIAALAPDFRDALVAVDLVGLSYGEAGKLLGRQGGDDHEPAVPRAGPGGARDGIGSGRRLCSGGT